MQTRYAHPFVKHLFVIINNEKYTPEEKHKKMVQTINLIYDLQKKELEVYHQLQKMSPDLPPAFQEAELKKPYSLDVEDNETSLLNTAIEKQLITIVELLLSKGAAPRFISSDNIPPLNYATNIGDIEIVNLLLKNGADPNSINQKSGNTPLIIAARDGHIDIVKRLINAGAKLNIVNPKDGTTPLYWAAENGHADIVSLLLEAGANFALADNLGDPLHSASIKGHANIVQMLLKAKADVDTTNKQGATPLHGAAQNSKDDVIKILIQANANPNHQAITGETPLYMSALYGSTETVRILLEAKANVVCLSEKGDTPLMAAACNNNSNKVKVLLQYGAQPNFPNPKTGNTPLFYTNNKEVVVALLDGNADVNFSNSLKQTPLHMQKSEAAIKILIQRGAKIDAVDSNGFTPLLFAAQEGNIKSVLALLEAKADPNHTNPRYKASPLVSACSNGNPDLVTLLLEKKADPNLNKNTSPPLFLAAQKNHPQIVSQLLQAGAEIDLPHWDSKLTALEHMVIEKLLAPVALLLSHHATVFYPDELYTFLMEHADPRDPDVLKALNYFCEQQTSLRQETKDVNKYLLLHDEIYSNAKSYLAKLTELTKIYEDQSKIEVDEGIKAAQRTMIPDVLKVAAGYSSPLESLSLFRPSDIDRLLEEVKSKKEQKPTI